MASLEGRNALVTGGTRGIGAAIAERLRDLGAAVTVTGRAPDGRAPEGCDYRGVDFTGSAATEEFAASLAERKVDVLVNNAGINKIAPFAEIDPADFDRIQQVNVRAPFLLTRAVVAGMRGRGWGRVVNVTSVFGVVSREQRGSYSTSKFGLDGMTAALAAEVARDGVLVNSVAPGIVATELTRQVLGPEGMERIAAQVPAGRLADPSEIAALVGWLVGPENTYVSGQRIAIDGGFTRV